MNSLHSSLLSLLFAAFNVTPLRAESNPIKTVVMGIDDFCPYTCLEQKRPGFLVELIEIILSQSGIKLNVVFGSWTRLQMLAEEGKVDLLGPLTLFYVEKQKIPATQELGGFLRGGFITQADATWRFADYTSLDSLKIAAVKDYSYPEDLEAHLNKAKSQQRYLELIGDDANRRLVKMLASKRVDTVPALFDVFFYHAMQLGLPVDKFKIAKEIPLDADRATYRVGVPIKDALRRTSLITILDRGFASLKADGTLKKIMMKYGVHNG